MTNLKSWLYWHRYRNLRVTLHLLDRDRTFAWTQIRGIQFRSWFIGAIQGVEVEKAKP